MSWSIEEHIGDFRPFPAQVVVYKGETGECLAYVSGEVADRLRAENNKLRDLVKKLYGGYMVSCNGCENAYEDYGGYTPLDPDYCVFSYSDRFVGCWKRKRLEAEMRELGVEVPDGD